MIKLKTCPFKFESETIDDSKVKYETQIIQEHTHPDGYKCSSFAITTPVVNGESISFGEEYKLPKRKALWCDMRNKECVGEKNCPIMKRN